MPPLRNKVSLLFQAFNSTELRIRPRGDATQLPLLNELIKSGHPSPTSRDGKFSAFADWSQSHPRMCPGRQHDMHWTARSNKVINEPGTIVRSPRTPPQFYKHRRSDSQLINILPRRNVLGGFVRNRGQHTHSLHNYPLRH